MISFAADSDGCCAGRAVMSRRLFSTAFILGTCPRCVSQSLTCERVARIRSGWVFSDRLDICSALDSQAGCGL
jgi:hypothetical protein